MFNKHLCKNRYTNKYLNINSVCACVCSSLASIPGEVLLNKSLELHGLKVPNRVALLTLICTRKSLKCSLNAGMSWFRLNSPVTNTFTCALNYTKRTKGYNSAADTG